MSLGKLLIDRNPETVAEAIALWDAGETVFSVEMGGLGPGYEMAIQGLAFELMRVFGQLDWSLDQTALNAQGDELSQPIISACNEKPWGGFSGAQVGAAMGLAANVCRHGYRKALSDEAVKDRLIQVSKKDLRQ